MHSVGLDAIGRETRLRRRRLCLHAQPALVGWHFDAYVHDPCYSFTKSNAADLITPLVAIGEICNFAAYAFAPAILVTPLGALSVLIGAVLGSYFLKEELGILGKLGSAICLIGAVVIVLHAPPDEEVDTVDQILIYALRPGTFHSTAPRACARQSLLTAPV